MLCCFGTGYGPTANAYNYTDKRSDHQLTKNRCKSKKEQRVAREAKGNKAWSFGSTADLLKSENVSGRVILLHRPGTRCHWPGDHEQILECCHYFCDRHYHLFQH